MSDEFDFNHLDAALAARTPAPPDVIAPLGLDRATIVALNLAAMTSVEVCEPGPIIESAEGDPLAVGPPAVGGFTLARPMIPRHALEAAGLTEAEVPNLRVVDVPGRSG